MSERSLLVHLEVDGAPLLAGRLLMGAHGGVEEAAFEPNPQWFSSPHHARYSLLVNHLPRGPQLSGGTMPLLGAIGDSAPDRWGRELIRRNERRLARAERRAPRVQREPDFLVGVDDEVRVGNVRFSEKAGGPFLGAAQRAPIPRLDALPRVLQAVQDYERGEASEVQMKLLLLTGQLLGGSRPKATLRDDDGHLLVAKFPSRSDERDMQRWEALALELASRCGIAVPSFRLASVEGQRVLLLRRFDREPGSGRRIAFLSAMGLLGARDNKSQSYFQIAEALRTHGGRPLDDIVQLWKRAVFTVLITNTDNHLRNHGLLHDAATGWRLAPAYDLTPQSDPVKPRKLAMSLDLVDDVASLDPLLERCEEFGLRPDDARETVRRIGGEVRRWREVAAALRLPADEVRKMRGAFEHEDLEKALR
jgi:serine/threonine-protein kinase HipA